jgi:hypothetical protein
VTMMNVSITQKWNQMWESKSWFTWFYIILHVQKTGLSWGYRITATIDTDCQVCSRPWHWFALGKANRPLFVTPKWCIPVKNTSWWSPVVFYACELIQLFSVLLCVVTFVHKFHFRVPKNETPDKWRRYFF